MGCNRYYGCTGGKTLEWETFQRMPSKLLTFRTCPWDLIKSYRYVLEKSRLVAFITFQITASQTKSLCDLNNLTLFRELYEHDRLFRDFLIPRRHKACRVQRHIYLSEVSLGLLHTQLPHDTSHTRTKALTDGIQQPNSAKQARKNKIQCRHHREPNLFFFSFCCHKTA